MKNEENENIKNVRNRKIYDKETEDKDDYDFWTNHYIWCFDFYVTKKWRYEEWYTEEYFNIVDLYNLTVYSQIFSFVNNGIKKYFDLYFQYS